ncbi:inositol monophosphatase family protein [Lacisediminihabitans profunda]|uniref:Histidinol-phosphatase n=1 Tax=Lacisediminihabitans profunda TaxID=2594790 RepID=A0A5C8UUK8_9MICO|nr:inositol monophosphatase family protein [Lacisediminihabitans profunda]TXN31326.1 histidinol phosphatase [Lacisediminihabitans profunda]
MNDTAYSLPSDLRLARELADMADAISMDRFRANDLAVSMKPDMTHVTDADKAVEAAIRAALRDSRPHDSVLGEEAGEEPGSLDETGASARQWIIDPIDGTANYVRGVPVWASLISLAIDGVPVVGVVSAPALGKRWWAAKGLGAFIDDSLGSGTGSSERRIAVSAVSNLSDASMSCSGLLRWEQAGKLDEFLGLARSVWRSRDYGDMWPYMMVAEGLVEIAGEYDMKPWDIAALIPIVEEAGGRFTSVAGEPGPWHGSAIATNGLLHDQVLRRFA